MNPELKIDCEKKKDKNQPPKDLNSQLFEIYNNSRTSFSPGREGIHIKTLEVYRIKTLEVYHVKTLEMYRIKTLEVYHIKTLEVYPINTLEVYRIKTLEVYLVKY